MKWRSGPLLLSLSIAIGGLVSAAYQPADSGEKPRLSPASKQGIRTGSAWEMPAFSLDGLDGSPHRLDEWKGKVILLNFWASWCAPCLYEIRELIDHQSTLGGQGLQIIGLGVDQTRKLRNVARTLGINYPVLIADPDGNGGLMRQWGNRTGVIPYNVVIGRDGRIAYIQRGPLNERGFTEQVLPLLNSPLP